MTLTLSTDQVRTTASLFRRVKCRNTLPIIDHIRITVMPGEAEATLETTDLDIHISTRLPIAGPTTPGTFTLPRSEFFHLAKAADKGTTIRFDVPNACDDACAVHSIHTAKGLRAERTVNSLPHSEFPAAPDLGSASRIILPSALLDAVRRVRPAASEDETRHVLRGVYLDPTVCGNVVATDGRRLAHVPVRVPTPACILPTQLIDVLQDPACQNAATARFSPEAEFAAITFGKTTITSRLIQGNFPNYKQVIPVDRNGSCTFPESIIAGILDFIRPHKDPVTLVFGPNTVTFTVKTKDQQTFSTSVPAYLAHQVPDRITFYPEFLFHGLAMGLHTLDLIDEMSPGILTDGLVRYVLMPMRVTTDAAAEETPEEPTDEESTQESPDHDSHDSHPSHSSPPAKRKRTRKTAAA